MYLADHLDDFNEVCKETLCVFEEVEHHLQLNLSHTHYCHGNFRFITSGISFGGGQMRPGNLRNMVHNEKVMQNLLANWAMQHVIQFINKMFAATNIPISHLLHHDHSIFASFILNVGGVTTRCHHDHLNLGPGACPVFAVGNFDPTKGGHLVLWDLKLVIEFPSGSLIIIPSALLEHSNIPISQDETCHSFTQYSAMGLFQWVDNGYRTDKDLEE
ncbi:uncharacterized protein ARMOST_03182 [Armillaria ostoyae]|uniref:Prolyl 4-hydroxylase alpha subunit Fe(2+) 2OG dioxygenase domain-containing protein n=1 Tax=Armillaria ostoyae TaxID=47428 RepID=A0A284QTZ8_ARMOS|nr:uncharacterized protein ARMOST_03182 [Armillaria ostoyae]